MSHILNFLYKRDNFMLTGHSGLQPLHSPKIHMNYGTVYFMGIFHDIEEMLNLLFPG